MPLMNPSISIWANQPDSGSHSSMILSNANKIIELNLPVLKLKEGKNERGLINTKKKLHANRLTKYKI